LHALGGINRQSRREFVSAATLNENATRILLEHFFEPLAPQQNSHAAKGLQSDDVFVCDNTAKDQFITRVSPS